MKIRIWWNHFYKVNVLTTEEIRNIVNTLNIPIEKINIKAVIKDFLKQFSEHLIEFKKEMLSVIIKRNLKKNIVDSKHLKL